MTTAHSFRTAPILWVVTPAPVWMDSLKMGKTARVSEEWNRVNTIFFTAWLILGSQAVRGLTEFPSLNSCKYILRHCHMITVVSPNTKHLWGTIFWLL